jgi:hypothetical protein
VVDSNPPEVHAVIVAVRLLSVQQAKQALRGEDAVSRSWLRLPVRAGCARVVLSGVEL